MSGDDEWNVFPKLKRLKEGDAGNTSIGAGSNKRTGQYFTERATASRQRGINVASKFGTGGLGRVLVSERKARDGDKLPGMEGLYHILCDMRRDIKKVSDAQSLQGAKKWAKKRYDDDSLALDTDLNDDGINEIVVYDPYGNPVMINGYTTKDSQWPVNQKYFAANPTKEERKAKSKRSFMDDEFQVRYDDTDHPGKVSFKQRGLMILLNKIIGFRNHVIRHRTSCLHQISSKDVSENIRVIVVYPRMCTLLSGDHL